MKPVFQFFLKTSLNTSFQKLHSFPKALLFQKNSFIYSTNKNPSEFSLEDFVKIGESPKELLPKDFVEPIIFFNNVLDKNKKLIIQPELVREKLSGFLTRLEENIPQMSNLKQLQPVFLFCRTLKINSEEFWLKFLTHTFALTEKEAIDPQFLKNITNLLSLCSDELRVKFQEILPRIIENNFFLPNTKYNHYTLANSVGWLYKWLIFRAGYDKSLKLDANDKATFDNYITPEFLNHASKIFPGLRRNFQGLSLSHKVYALTVYSALYHNQESEKEIYNILKRVSTSISKNIENFSCLQLVMLTQIFIRTNYNQPAFWQALESYILTRLETDFSINYLIKYLQGFSHFKAGSLGFYMEIDRYIGFHPEELTASDVPTLIKIYTEMNRGRQKFFGLMELKIMEFKNEFNLNEIVEMFHSYALMNYLTTKLFFFFEAKIMEQVNSLDEHLLLKVIDSLRILKKSSPLFELLKPKITEIVKSTKSENSLICITAAYYEKQLNSQVWYNDLSKKIKEVIENKNRNFLLKLGGLLVKASNELFDKELYEVFKKKCKEMDKEFNGNEKKDIHFILWKLGSN